MSEIYRNHPTVILRNLLLFAVFAFLMSISLMKNPEIFAEPAILVALVAIALGFVGYFVLYWYRATIRIEDNNIIAEYGVLYLTKKVIPFNKIASANVIRTLSNRIFGTTTLQITINSSRSALSPNISYVFKNDLAEKIRAELMYKAFGQAYTEKSTMDYDNANRLKNKNVPPLED